MHILISFELQRTPINMILTLCKYTHLFGYLDIKYDTIRDYFPNSYFHAYRVPKSNEILVTPMRHAYHRLLQNTHISDSMEKVSGSNSIIYES